MRAEVRALKKGIFVLRQLSYALIFVNPFKSLSTGHRTKVKFCFSRDVSTSLSLDRLGN
jgi:hypothetical protein